MIYDSYEAKLLAVKIVAFFIHSSSGSCAKSLKISCFVVIRTIGITHFLTGSMISRVACSIAVYEMA